MSVYGLNRLIGQACISDSFQADLMNGRRAELIQRPEFDLNPDEALALLAIQSDTFAEFAAAVESLLGQRETRSTRADGLYLAAGCRPSAVSPGLYFRHER